MCSLERWNITVRSQRGKEVMVLSGSGEVVTAARLLDTFWKRFLGLGFVRAGRDTLPVILYPCRSVHTLFMRFPLDLYFISGVGKVLKIMRNVPPKRIVPPVKGAEFVLEIPSKVYQLPDIGSVSIPNLIEM